MSHVNTNQINAMPYPVKEASRPSRQRRLGATVATAEVIRRLSITRRSLLIWRDGSPQRKPLTANVARYGKTTRVRFDEVALVNWLNQYRPDLVHRWLYD